MTTVTTIREIEGVKGLFAEMEPIEPWDKGWASHMTISG